MTRSKRSIQDVVLVSIVAIIGLFIVLSLVAQFVLVWSGKLPADQEGVFQPLFDLVAILVGGVGGYVTGQTVERKKRDDEPEK